MAQFYEHKTKVDSRDVDGLGHCRASALLGHLQEAATMAGENGGFGRVTMRERHNGFWMLTRMWYQLDRPLRWGEDLTIRTWHRGGKGAVSYRDYDIYDGTGFWKTLFSVSIWQFYIWFVILAIVLIIFVA